MAPRTYTRPVSARMARDAAALAAVNGVFSPSRVGVGKSPEQGHWISTQQMIHPCALCGRQFSRRYHVKSHFPACVSRNGNPSAARWDDAWSGGAAPPAPAPQIGNPAVTSGITVGQEESESEEDEDRAEGEDERTGEGQVEKEKKENEGDDGNERTGGEAEEEDDEEETEEEAEENDDQDEMDLDAAEDNTEVGGLEEGDDDVEDEELAPPAAQPGNAPPSRPAPTTFNPNALTPYNPNLPMNTQTTDSLFEIVQAWHDRCRWKGVPVVDHPHLLDAVGELRARGYR